MPTERRWGTTTPWASKAAAERTTAPRLRGSVTPSSATISGGGAGAGGGGGRGLRGAGAEGRAARVAGAVEQVLRVRVVVGRHLQADALVQRPLGHPVELRLAHLEQREP